MLVQEYLLTKSLADLRVEHGVKHRWSAKRPGVFTLNYDQLEVVDTDPLSQECRGLILRAAEVTSERALGPTSIIARPFARFFNHGTGPCADVDFARARFYEKLDGTLCIVHFDDGWHVATRSVPDADVPIDGGRGTFRDLFETAWSETHEGTPPFASLEPSLTYLFELCCPENQVVVKHIDRRVWLLGARGLDGREVDPLHHAHVVNVCPSHEVTLASLSEFVHGRDASKHEGLVVCDHEFRRCKVKSAAYIALAHTRDSVGRSDRRLLELVLAGRQEEARTLLPPYLIDRMEAFDRGVGRLFDRLDRDYETWHDPDRKTFALRVQAHGGWMGPMMARWSGKCADARGWVQTQKRDGSWADPTLDLLLSGAGLNEPPA